MVPAQQGGQTPQRLCRVWPRRAIQGFADIIVIALDVQAVEAMTLCLVDSRLDQACPSIWNDLVSMITSVSEKQTSDIKIEEDGGNESRSSIRTTGV
jgi:hypothetical protein